MSILSRFNDIIKANINALLDKAEDPAKMIDQYLREMTDDLAEVKGETASVMAEETRTMRLADENQAQVDKYDALARKALQAGNETDARVFLARKQELEAAGAGLKTAYAAAHENAVRMREMHDKLARDIETLKSRRQSIKAKVTVAKTQEKINELSSASEKVNGAMGAFERMEEKANTMLDEANAMSELNNFSVDEALKLEEKYAKENAPSVDDALAKLKEEMGL
ncbi:MAG: PspA/IM30 family protein [Eubacteriales bacterium]|nr:PspA/IM30 family protein [Clostridium sp.]MDY6080710.1 PspA/IM30 family protein [Eubacteriales bacterium]